MFSCVRPGPDYSCQGISSAPLPDKHYRKCSDRLRLLDPAWPVKQAPQKGRFTLQHLFFVLFYRGINRSSSRGLEAVLPSRSFHVAFAIRAVALRFKSAAACPVAEPA